MSKIRYGPCANWSQKKSIILFGTSQYTLYELKKYTHLGKFMAGTEDHQELVAAAAEAFGKACMTQMSGESVFTCPQTQEELDRRYLDKEHNVVDGKEAVERLMGLLREGTWLVEDNGITDGELSGERLETPTPNQDRGAGMTGGESIDSLSQKLGIDKIGRAHV